jgi:hypothetical protein
MEKRTNATGGNKKTGQSGEKIPQSSSTKRKTPKQVMSHHIKDKNHVISEEEFKNLKTGADLTTDTAHDPLELPEDKTRPKDEDKDPKIVTPWDVIS